MATSLFPCCVPLISKNSLSSAFADDCCSKKSCATPEKKDPHSDNADSCSPFFSCGSCVGFSASFPCFSPLKLQESLSHKNYYHLSLLDDVCNKKWQPPKIV